MVDDTQRLHGGTNYQAVDCLVLNKKNGELNVVLGIQHDRERKEYAQLFGGR